MNEVKVKAAMAEAKRFLKRAERALKVECDEKQQRGYSAFYGSKETGALRRSSLDLTRSLAEMRRP